jgi:hypothetical protein
MSSPEHLHILWTNADPVTAEKMVFMYAYNALKERWWKRVTVIIWGAPAKLVADNWQVQSQIRALLENGVQVSACKACADELGVTETLKGLGIEVIYWGESLTRLLKDREVLLSV